METQNNGQDQGTAKLVTAKTLASVLNKHPNTIYRWCRQQKIPHHRVFGRGLLFDVKAVEAVVFAEGS